MTADGRAGLNPVLDAIVDRVRQASSEGRVKRLEDVWPGSPEALVLALGPGQDDIGFVEVGGTRCVFSERLMTRRFAEAAARSATRDAALLVAETVRDDSTVYPRPTAIPAFGVPPYSLSPAEVEAALVRIGAETAFNDIQTVEASDGSRFLFSTRGLDADRARSMAEWIAVGRDRNP